MLPLKSMVMVLCYKMKAICYKMYAIVLIFSGFYLALFTFRNQLYKNIVMGTIS